jgi:dTDP-4-dehydrorhamnose 3,5-epimerase
MKISTSAKIPGLRVITPDVFYDFRGEFVETYRLETYRFDDLNGQPVRFIEDDISVSRRHVLRGLHGDAKTWKLVQCVQGAIYYVVADLRKESNGYLQWESFALNEQNRQQVLVPAGCANGHLVLSESCVFTYKQSEYYSGMRHQFTVRWDDPKLGIFWPVRQPMLSERDASAAYLTSSGL